MMQPIPIQLRERTPLHRPGEPLRFGVPLLKGILSDTGRLQLLAADGISVPAQFRPFTHWPDGSIRWVCVDALAGAGSTDLLLTSLAPSEPRPGQNPTADVHTENQQLTICYKNFQLHVDTGAVQWHWSGPDSQNFSSELTLDDQHDVPCAARLEGSWQVSNSGPVATTLTASGWWLDGQDEKLARFRCELTFYANGLVTVDAMIHNPRRARHPGGLWDLGDAGSIHFGAMAVKTDTPRSEQFRLTVSADETPGNYPAEQPLCLHQESSGGDNWNSRNHINADGQILPRYRGYRLQYGAEEPRTGLRASPVLESKAGSTTIAISQPHFWQNFPSAISADRSTVTAWLFPSDKREPYELQGGERKTQRVILGYGQRLEQLAWTHSPLVPVIPPEHYEAAEVFPWFRAGQPKTALDELIQEGLDGPSNFFAKREVIDEYGWRNFGDIFADHETLYQKEGETPFISHYNNQYDAIYGFARQFALTGDPRWFELMDDLARHVVDIDIYHTNEDRAEYNDGLFWHTDHYLDAHTATHRTFSRHNDTSSTPGQTGGGPGTEHCYTTGLLYHFLMTGNTGSRSAVLGLARWMVSLHDGSRGLLAQLLAVKKQEVPKLKALIRGERPSAHQYPFTRGTGNYLIALLDAATLEPGKDWLQKAGQVIRETIHPADDIEARNLLDVETGWSYLILLAAIFRYLWTKRKLGETDETYHYARQSLLHYTAWMKANERPFLQDPEPLEFANDTWVAQDIRKAMLMFNAAELSQDKEAEDYLATGQQWLDQVCQTLQKSPEKHFSRILVILAQNYGPQTTGSMADASASAVSHSQKEPSAPILTWPQLVARILQRLGAGLTQFRPSREKAWLDARMNR